MNKKSKEEQEAMDKWWEEHTSDPKVVEEMFKNSAKSEAEIPGRCFREYERIYQGDSTNLQILQFVADEKLAQY